MNFQFQLSDQASTTTSDDDEDDDEFDLDEGDEPDAATIDRSGNAAANRLEAVIASIARRDRSIRGKYTLSSHCGPISARRVDRSIPTVYHTLCTIHCVLLH